MNAVGQIISNLCDPRLPQDGATKNYVDNKKCLVGYIPSLEANSSKTGFTAAASSSYSSSWSPYMAFNSSIVPSSTGNEWATASVNTNFWISIACLDPVRIWRVALRGRYGNAERIYNWRIEGSTDNSVWTTLYTAANPTYLGGTIQFFNIRTTNLYQYYRLYYVNAETTNPGLSVFQLYIFNN